MHISTWNKRCTAVEISKMPLQGTVVSPANPLPIRSASWACNRGPQKDGAGTRVQQSLPWNYWAFHLCILVCRWSLVGPWQLGWCRVLRVSADTWCGLLEPLHLPGRGSWQPHPHSLGLESAIRHLPALLPSPPSTSGRVEYVEEGLGSTSALHPWEGPGCDGEVWD